MSSPNPTTHYDDTSTSRDNQVSQCWSQSTRSEDDARRGETTTTPNVYQAALRTPKVRVSYLWVVWRLLRVSLALGYWALGVFLNRFSRMELEERERKNAVRFRKTLERLGGVLIKVGQQMSQRPDILPAAYCDELLMLLRNIPERIPIAAVEAAIRRQTGKSIDELFCRFDWEPVGSASVACVYKAVLH